MTKLRQTCVLLSLVTGASIAFGQDIAVNQQHFSYGVSLREAYDSNLFTEQNKPLGSFSTTVSPSVNFSWSSPNTDLSVHYSYSAVYYENRPRSANAIDQAHNFSLNLAHEFTPRLRVALADNFTPGFQPDIQDGTLHRRVNGDYIQNQLLFSPSYNLGGRFSLPVNFHHFFIDYRDSGLAQRLNRQEIGGGPTLRYNLNSTTSFGVSVDHSVTTYGSFLDRGSTSDKAFFELNHSFSPRLTMGINVGGEARFYNISAGTQYNPDISVSVSYAISPRTSTTIQYHGHVQQTDVTRFLSQRVHTISGGVVHQFTPRLLGSVNATFIPSEYLSSVRINKADLPADPEFATPFPKNATEVTYVFGGNLSYQFNLHLRLETGYTYTTVDSGFLGRHYQRSLGYVQTSFGF